MEAERMKKNAAPPSLSIRGFREDDAEALARWAGDDRILCHFDDFEELAGAGVDAARSYIAEELVPHPCFLAVCLGSGAPVGAVSVTREPCDRGALHRGEIGYFVEPEHWARGIATTAVGTMVQYAFGRWPGLARLDAVVQVENGASQRVLEKNGFSKEGLLREYVDRRGRGGNVFLYRLLRSDLGWDDEQPDIL